MCSERDSCFFFVNSQIFGFFGELETDVGFRDMFHLGDG